MRFVVASLLPALVALLIGTTPGLACGPGMMVGSLFATPLMLAGALLVSLPARTSLPVAAVAAAAAFLIRLGGAMLVLFAVMDRADATAILATLTACLLAGLAIEMAWWLRTSRSFFTHLAEQRG
jgi:hypothetical protein